MYKKAWCTCKCVVLVTKPIAFLTFFAAFVVVDLKVPNPTGKRAAWSSGQRVEVAIQPWRVQAPPWPLAGFVFRSFRVQTIKRENLQQHSDVVIKWKIVSHGLRISFNAAQHYTEWRELECCRYFSITQEYHLVSNFEGMKGSYAIIVHENVK